MRKVMIRSQSHCFRGIIITIYFFFCLFPLPNTFASPTQFLCRVDQRDTLLELKKEFPVSWRKPAAWNKSVDCCSWEGVICDNLGKVKSLELNLYSNANTSLKPSSGLFKLQHLTHLDLSYSNLQGEIPSSIGNLSQLTFLDLSYNNLVGEVPASVGNLNQLRYMSLRKNDLRGNIPTSFANLTKLSELDLSDNQFTSGVIVLANLTSLSKILLSSNHFKSPLPADLSGLHNLSIFFANENSFFGPFPSSLLMIPSLARVDLSQNQFEGAIDFGNTSSSSQLESLDVRHNNFDGPLPKSISKLRNLKDLYMSHNNFSGQVPRSLSKLVNLTFFEISHNKMEGQVPHFLWRSSKLYSVQLSHNSFTSFSEPLEISDRSFISELDLSSNSLQGPFPQWICNFKILFTVDLSNNHFTGSIPQCLKNSTSIQRLILRNNSLSGFIPDLCKDGAKFEALDVSHNNLEGKLPKSFLKCKKMEFLNVRGNKIKDTFPFWLGSLQSLVVLVLRSNAFYGPVYNSSAYVGFPSMRIIDISNNNFVGSLPQDYFTNWTEMSKVWNDPRISTPHNITTVVYFDSYLVDLVYKGVDIDLLHIFEGFKAIDFSGNRFSGHIPRSIGLLSELRLLNLSGNTFTGNIPPSLANITNLETLDLSRNNLSGNIPQDLGKLSSLSMMDFSHNHLEGLVPQSTQFGTQKCSSFMGNLGLYGLEKICKENHVPVPTLQQPEESSSESEEPVVNWIAAAIAFGPGVFCGLVIGYIFTSYKQKWFMAR